MSAALTIRKTFDRIQSFIGSRHQGLRQMDGWNVADGELAGQEAIRLYLAQGGTAPPEITMTAHLTSLYGGQIAVAPIGIMLFLPEGFPTRIERIGLAAGFEQVEVDGRAYRLLRWGA